MVAIAAGTVLGILIFLVGLRTMTQGLRNAAGQRLRWILQRFTASRTRPNYRAATAPSPKQQCHCGAAVGLVDAKLLSLEQALGSSSEPISDYSDSQLISFNG